jgi:hypothetical protein
MAISQGILPIPVGKASQATDLATQLGRLFETADGKIYRLVKAAADIATAARFAVVTAVTAGGLPTWLVNTTTTANNYLAVGVVPAGQVGTGSTATTLLAGDYFLVQASGVATIVSAGAIAAGALVGTSTTAGKVDDASIGAGIGAIGVALLAASAGDENPPVLLKGLL